MSDSQSLPPIPADKIDTDGTILARLLRAVIYNLHVTPLRFQAGLENFVNSRDDVPASDEEREVQIGNLRKELEAPMITWPVFLKGLRVLGVDLTRLSITGELASGHVIEQHVALKPSGYRNSDAG